MLFALLFGTALVLIRISLPEGAEPGRSGRDGGHGTRLAAILMPFAGITFLWFIGVVRDGFGGFEDKFFSIGVHRQRAAFPGDDFRLVSGRRGVELQPAFATGSKTPVVSSGRRCCWH